MHGRFRAQLRTDFVEQNIAAACRAGDAEKGSLAALQLALERHSYHRPRLGFGFQPGAGGIELGCQRFAPGDLGWQHLRVAVLCVGRLGLGGQVEEVERQILNRWSRITDRGLRIKWDL